MGRRPKREHRQHRSCKSMFKPVRPWETQLRPLRDIPPYLLEQKPSATGHLLVTIWGGGPLRHCGWGWKTTQPCQKTGQQSHKIHRRHTYDPAPTVLGVCAQEWKLTLTLTPVYKQSPQLCSLQSNGKQARCPTWGNVKEWYIQTMEGEAAGNRRAPTEHAISGEVRKHKRLHSVWL